MTTAKGPLDVAAFEAANARTYLKAVFAAWEDGQCVMALPEGAGTKTVPGTKVLTRQAFAADPGWFEADLPAHPDDARALIAFSSGTTGRPKAILLKHRALQNVVGRINTAMGIDDTIREYLGVPVTYSFGFGRARAVAAAGGAAYLPEHGFDPSEIATMLGKAEINAVSAVPTLWRVLLANKGSIPQESALNLKWIEIGSQWMTAAEKLELHQLFPNAKIIQHYGLTEASRTTLLDVSEAPEERLDSVGRAEGGVEIAIDSEGRIRTRGPHCAEGLVSGAGVKPVTDADGWLTTSDRGRIEDGWLSYEGRIDELINAGGLKIDPTAFEQAVNTALGVPGAVAAGRLPDALRGEKVLVALRQDASLDPETVTAAISTEAARIGLTGSGSFELREVAELPLTGTGKVKRAELADLEDLATQSTAAAAPQAPQKGSKSGELQALWGEILGLDSVPTDKGFYDLGGDSLSALTAVMKMHGAGIDADTARGIFEGKTIAELVGEGAEAAQDSAPEAPRAAPASNEKTAALQTLWGEILGLDTVPTDKSFYDLGGDSLSALTAVMKMQGAGVDADTARGIFEGKTIAEMAGEGAETPSDTATSGKHAELQSLWGEILGLETVPTDKSFYDLGGDSLSALTAVMKMQGAGVDADTARGIFEGKTIAEMAGETIDGTDDVIPTQQPDAGGAEQAVSAPIASGRVGALQALWGEILGLDTVPADKSFYDLGGDSLSALTAVMKMQGAGIDAETARGIFEGKSITDLAGTDTAQVAAAGGKAGDVQALWGEILGLDTVPIDKSFYDLGGDSLSAITTVMKMQSLDIDAETARGIFEGKTISELTGAETAPAAPPVAAPIATPATAPVAAPAPEAHRAATGPVLTLAETVNSIHAARGVLVLWVVLAHWLPGLLVRIGEDALQIYVDLIPAWRLGTPGFAMVFGMGVGALGVHHYLSNRDLFFKSSRFNTKLIVGGVLTLAAANLTIVVVTGQFGERNPMSGLFYSAITYYALAMLTLPLLVWLITRGPNRLLTVLAIGAGAALIHEVLRNYVNPLQPASAFLEFLKITFSAKYGFFRMTSFVMFGVAIGWLFRQYHAKPGVLRDMMLAALILISFGIVGFSQADMPLNQFGRSFLWHMSLYAGVTLTILTGFALLNRAGGVQSRAAGWFNAFFIASGILALPIFVGHELVLRFKRLLNVLGVPDAVGLVLLLSLFFAGMFVAYSKLMRILVRPIPGR